MFDMWEARINGFWKFNSVLLSVIPLGWTIYDNIIPWHNQELYQSNSYTKCYGIYKTVQHNGEYFF